MSNLEEKVGQWCEQNFGVKMHSKDFQSLLRSKNGNLYKKFFAYMCEHIKSKENGREVKRFCESVRLQNELKIVTEDFNKVSSDVTQVCNELSVDENKRRRQQIEENMNRKKEIVSSLIVNAIESIASKDKKNCSQFRPVSDETINRIGESYLNRLAPITLVVTKTEGAGDSAVKRVTKSDLEDKIDQINEVVSDIGSVLYHINQIEIKKPTTISYDMKSVEKCLVPSSAVKEEKSKNKNEFDAKSRAIAAKLETVNNLMNTYQTKRTEKFAKNKEKLEKVIHSCDDFIQTNA